MSNKNKIIKPLPPLQCIQNFPYVDESINAINNWQLLQKVWTKCGEVVDLSNLTQEQQTELYNYVSNYFANLDVQENIDNKIDEMINDGSLLNLIKPFLDTQFTDINNNLSVLNENIKNLASGSPKGVYDTVQNLIAANPETGVYIVTADGHIYSWTKNGSQPVDLGVYQSTSIADNSIDSSMLKDNVVTYSKIGDYNLKTIEDYFINNNIFKPDNNNFIAKTNDDPSQNTTEVLTPFAYGVGLHFNYNNLNQYKFLYMPKIRLTQPGYLTILIVTSEAIGKVISYFINDNNVVKCKQKFYMQSGEHSNVVIPLNQLNYSNLVNGQDYYLLILQLNDEINPKASLPIYYQISNTNELTEFFNTSNPVIWIKKEGLYVCQIFPDINQYRYIVPALALSNINPLNLDLIQFIQNIVYNNKLVNKKINCMGDSITRGINGASSSGDVVEFPYPQIIANENSCISNNYGRGGSTIGGDGISVNETTQSIMGYLPMSERLNTMDITSDINIIMGGTNDCLSDRQVPLGKMGDTTNLTFYGALDIIANYLLSNFSTKINVFITPIKARNQDTANLFNLKLEDYANAIVKVAAKYGIPCLDLYNQCGGYPVTNTIWRQNNLPDGIHPTQQYYYYIAHQIANFINNLI